MSGLQLVRIPIDLRALSAFAVAEGIDDDDCGYATHLALRLRFGTAAPQPFRLFEEARGGPHLLGYVADAQALADADALPPQDIRLADIFTASPACRAMPTEWRVGARYAFEVRVRPIVRFGRRLREERGHEGKSPAGERDAFLAAIDKAGDAPVDRETVYRDWILKQLSGAVDVEAVELRLMRRLKMRRSSHGQPGSRRIEGYAALFDGTLAIADVDDFPRLLARGVGRHAAFGFGMLVLAPPRRG